MSWITNFVRPKIRKWVQMDTPDDLWVQSPVTGQMIFRKDLEKNLWVCPHSGYHMRISARDRLKSLFDEGEFATVKLPETPLDPLKFKDLKRYVDRVRDANAKNEDKEAILVAHGTMGGSPVVIAAFNFSYMGGSMGTAVGEGLLAASRLAVIQRAPLLVIPSSGGARMQQGILSLMQMPRSIIAVNMVKEAGLPYVVLLTDPTTGGVSASFAMLGDIQIAEPGATIGFAGKRVIEETIREKLPESFQTAEYLFERGMLDMVVHRHEMRDTLIRIFQLLVHKDPAAEAVVLENKREKTFKVETAEAEIVDGGNSFFTE